jgi:hypothetical protein
MPIGILQNVAGRQYPVRKEKAVGEKVYLYRIVNQLFWVIGQIRIENELSPPE